MGRGILFPCVGPQSVLRRRKEILNKYQEYPAERGSLPSGGNHALFHAAESFREQDIPDRRTDAA